MKFTPVVENKRGEGDEAFLTDYPKNILLSEDLELVPWLVGVTSSDGAYCIAFFPDFFLQEGEPKFLHQKLPINFCHLVIEMVMVTRRACHLILFQTVVIKFKTSHYFF
jgi:hypothetical protein